MNIKELEKEYYRNRLFLNKRELIEIFPEAVPYLEESRDEAIIFSSAFEQIIKFQLEAMSDWDSFDRWFWTEVLAITDGYILDKYDKRIKEINQFLNPWPKKEGQITDDDILRAKEYPFEELIRPVKVYGRGHFMAICPFHSEKKPSFFVRNSFAHCFGCNWSGDSIQFIMETEGLGFIEAVKRLN